MPLPVIVLIFLLGYGLLQRLDIPGGPWEKTTLAFPLGLAAATLVVFLLSLLAIHLNPLSVPSGFFLLALLLWLPELRRMGNSSLRASALAAPLRGLKNLHATEWLGICLLLPFLMLSIWKSYYNPVTPYDSIHGIDLVAKYAVADGRLDSRIYQDLGDLFSTQPYYAPFTALSQIIFRLAGFPFGKVWISILYASFLLAFYLNLKRYQHPFWAVFLAMMLVLIPELYGYSYLLQTDFPNAVFVSLAVIYLYRYLDDRQEGHFRLAALLMGLGCWSRSETISLALATAGLMWLFLRGNGKSGSVAKPLVFCGVALLFFGIWNLFYLPVVLHYSPESYFDFRIVDAGRLRFLLAGMWEAVNQPHLWGYLFFIFLIATALNLILFQDQRNVFLLLWVMMFFAVFLILLYYLQLPVKANINYTFRRGLFKLWPVAIFYMGSSALFIRLSQRIRQWEEEV